MSVIDIPRSDYVPHPTGQHEGIISKVEDLGMKDTPYGEKHKIAIRVSTAAMDDGKSFEVQIRVNLSGDRKSSLRKLREQLLGRKLEGDEPWAFDLEELKDIRVGYVVSHNDTDDGRTYANVESIWPLERREETEDQPDGDGKGDLPF